MLVNSGRREAKEEQHKNPFVELFFLSKVVKEGENITSLVVFSKSSVVEGGAQQCNKLVKKKSVGRCLERLLCTCICAFSKCYER